MEPQPLVLVTGITGFVGSQIALQLLESNYRVRGTVRSLSNKSKLEPIKNLPNQQNLTLVEADLLKPETWDKAVEGCDYVLHVASPFPTVTPKDENLLIKPAVEGTISVLKAVANHKEVKHIVITSSVAAIMSCGKYAKSKYNEEDWPNMSYIPSYNKSKALAEKAAWDFYNKLKAEREAKKESMFKLTVINPGYIFGPSLVSTDFSSGSIIKQVLTGELLSLVNLSLSIVDVRDVAQAHIKAMLSDKADGQRYLCTNNTNMSMKELSDLLCRDYKKKGFKPTTLSLPYWMVWLYSWYDKQAETAVYMWGNDGVFSNDKIKKDLGMTFRSSEEAVKEMVESLIKFKMV